MTETLIIENGKKFLNGNLKWQKKSRSYVLPYSEGGGQVTEHYTAAYETVQVLGLKVVVEHVSEKGQQFKRIVSIEESPQCQIIKDEKDLKYWVSSIFKEKIWDVPDVINHFEEQYQKYRLKYGDDVWMIYIQSTGNYEREKYFSKRIYNDTGKFTM